MEFREYIHAAPTVLFRGMDLTLQLILPDESPALPLVELCYTVSGKSPRESKVRMLPCDGYRAAEMYTVFAATVKAAELQGEQFTYTFSKDGAESITYTVPIKEPDLPPLVLAETALQSVPYFEFQNPGAQTVDLADYEIIRLRCGKFERNALAEKKGVNLIPGGCHAAVYLPKEPLTETENLQKKAETLEACELYHAANAEKDDILFYFAPRQIKLDPRNPGDAFYVVPQGGDAQDAVYEIRLRRTTKHIDAHWGCATLWQYRAETPRLGHFINTVRAYSPGFLHPAQTVCDYGETTVPAILPISPSSRIMRSDGDAFIRFAVIGGGSIGNATVYLREEDGFTPYVAYQNDEGLFTFTVPFKKLAYMKDTLAYYVEVQGGFYAACLGSEKSPIEVCLSDDCGPEILTAHPAAYQVLENQHFPEIRFTYHDISGVNTHISVLCLDGLNVSQNAMWSESGVTFKPLKALDFGTHTVELTLRDMHGNRTYYKSDFAIGDGKELHFYCGQVHSHTFDSDGRGTPEEAYAYARDVSHMDYFAVTDHSQSFTESDYQRQIEVANAANDPCNFAAIYGFEMTYSDLNGYFGHTNLLNPTCACHTPNATDLDAYYKFAEQHNEAVAMFNHPRVTWGNFDEFHPAGDKLRDQFALLELNVPAVDHAGYALALSKGWRVSPVYNEDTHHADWGITKKMGVVLAPALTRENILDAMRRRRTYTTSDRTLRVYYRVNGAWLGSVLDAPETLDVEVEITTECELGIGKIELLTEDSIVVATVEAGALSEFRWHVELNPDFDYYYLRITNAKHYTVTAPVFVENRDILSIKRMGYGVSEDAEHPHVVTATVKNESDKVLSDVTVDFYLTDEDAFVLRQLSPFEEVHVGKLAPGETRTVSRRFPDIAGHHRVSAIASGMVGKQRYADTSYVMISPLTVTKLMPLTSDLTKDGVLVKNPYPYVEIYNHTAKPISLKGYTLGLWKSIGKKAPPVDDRVLSLSGFTIPPASTLTVWMRSEDSPLTAADFNAHYGVKLLEGEDLMITSQPIMNTDNAAKKMDIRHGSEVLARATFGYHYTHATDVELDRVLCYAFAPHVTQTLRFLPKAGEKEAPLPGKPLACQIPRKLKGLCRKSESKEAQRSATRKEVFTRLTKSSLVPFRAAAFVANAVSAFKGFFDTKE